MKVKLEDIIDGMEMQFEGTRTFCHMKTGEVISVSKDDLRKAEEIEDEEIEKLRDWEQENIRVAIDVVEYFEDYAELPTTFEINEYDMMEQFCFTVKNPRTEQQLLDAIRGKGAFRRFKDSVLRLGIEEDWYSFRQECYKQKAIDWCREHELEYVEGEA